MTLCRPALVLALFVMGFPAPGQSPDPDAGRPRGESGQTRTRLVECQRKLEAGQSGDAADDLLKLIDETGDDLVSADGKSFLPARRFAFALLARIPAEELRSIRDRIDVPAAELLQRGRSRRDAQPLRQLVERYFVARPAEEALLFLGDLAFERGEFRAAEGYWRRLLPGGPPEEPSFPDPKADPAAIRARVALAALFAGDPIRAGAELLALKDRFPRAEGRLAGRDGPYVETLEHWLRHPPQVLPERTPSGDWTAFAGSSARRGTSTASLARHWPPLPEWRTPIPPAGTDPADRPRTHFASARNCAFHPVVMNGVAYIADAARVIGFDLETGSATVVFDLRHTPGWENLPAEELRLPPPPGTAYTLTAAHGRLYARLGRQAVAPALDLDGKPEPTGVLVCLAPERDDKGWKVTWELAPPGSGEATSVAWEAAPVVSAGRLYAAFTRFEGNRAVHSVAAYDDPPGRPLWVTDVSDAPLGAADIPRTRPEPLTLAGNVLVFCSHNGIASAVDADTGKPAWAFRYPRARRLSGTASPRDLCPAVYDDGRVFIAPADADAVFALDADTGKPLWELPGVQVSQLLGVSRGRLVVSFHKPVKGIRGLSVIDGDSREPAGWQTHDDPLLGSFGRGIVAEEFVLWPTDAKEGTYLIRTEDGTNAAGWQTLLAARGNLAYASDTLIVASPTEVMAYRPYLGRTSAKVTDTAVWPVKLPTPGQPFPAKRPPDRLAPFDLRLPIGLKSVPLPNPRCVPLLPFPGETDLPGLGSGVTESARHLVVTDGATVFGYRPGQGKPGWSIPLPDGYVPTHATAARDRLILAGPRGAAVLRLTDGSLGPVVRIPDDAPDLSAFALAGSRLIARVGGHHLVGLDPSAGRIAWVLDGNRRPRFAPHPFARAPAFGPYLGSDGNTVVCQVSTGRRWSVDGDTGQVKADEPTALNPWDAPPALTPDGEMIVADGAGMLRWLKQTAKGESGRAFEARGEASLTGRPPVARWLNGSVLVGVQRNYGFEVDRLWPNGTSAWFQSERELDPVVFHANAIDLTAADADDQWAFIPAGGRLSAMRWGSGRGAWAVDLDGLIGSPAVGETAWAVRAGRSVVVAWPTSAIPFDLPVDVLTRAARRNFTRPVAGRLPGLAVTAYDAWAVRTVPVLVFDPASGTLMQRLDLPATGPTVATQLGPGPSVIVTAGTAHWLR